MAGFNTASTMIKVVFILSILGVILQLVGFATPYWNNYPSSHRGLWKACHETFHGSQCGSYYGEPGWLKATQAFETLGFIAAVAALILIVLYVFVPATSGKRIVFILSMVACFIAAGCILLGIIIYGTKMDYNLSWSFALCCIAGIIFAVAGLLLAIDFCKR
ncbi:uncharacterized protein LOC128204072 isoform X5 [Mya arenaria]|uniref:uncharacterized protein LOC128204072 isoform X5 n=1 Tax=Mya arenaria TaxID=6604 RepID=UPI0022E3C9A0|nr:uncharacterized protein LOC128204072 isoform X5 [Mya arenaria]